jgi:hypothetical protein
MLDVPEAGAFLLVSTLVPLEPDFKSCALYDSDLNAFDCRERTAAPCPCPGEAVSIGLTKTLEVVSRLTRHT